MSDLIDCTRLWSDELSIRDRILLKVLEAVADKDMGKG